MKIRPLEAELFRADGHKDRHGVASGRFSQFCERSWKVVEAVSRLGKMAQKFLHLQCSVALGNV